MSRYNKMMKLTFAQFRFPSSIPALSKEHLIWEWKVNLKCLFSQCGHRRVALKKPYQCRTDWVVPNPISIAIYIYMKCKFSATQTHQSWWHFSFNFIWLYFVSFCFCAALSLALVSLSVVVWKWYKWHILIIIIVSIHFVWVCIFMGPLCKRASERQKHKKPFSK